MTRRMPKPSLQRMLAIGFPLLVWGLGGAADRDRDGIPDDLEFRLANQFAPILFYDAEEPNLPASVQRFLGNTELWYFSEACRPERVLISKSLAAELLKAVRPSCLATGALVDSQGTRSPGKKSTFYLKDVPQNLRRGGEASDAWTTYVHAYPNDLGGVTLQYWRFYAYNSSYFMGFPVDFGTHGGDWEAIHVVLKPGPSGGFTPVQIRLLGHRDIITRPWSGVIAENGHPLILCEKGSHTSLLMSRSNLDKRSSWIEHESWTGGSVRWPGGKASNSGPLVLLGQKTSPAPGMEWLRYSGLWGTRQSAGLAQFYDSGYWGPAYNETGLRKDGFVSAWCEGIARPLPIEKECYSDHLVP
jgi:hypothetical protein